MNIDTWQPGFGKAVEKLRKERGWTIGYAAPLMDLHPATLYRIEQEHARPKKEVLRRIVNALAQA